MTREQYQEYDENYCIENAFKWFCHNCQDQDKGITQKETPIAWGKMKDIEEIRKARNLAYEKTAQWKKICKSEEQRLEKH